MRKGLLQRVAQLKPMIIIYNITKALLLRVAQLKPMIIIYNITKALLLRAEGYSRQELSRTLEKSYY